MTLFGDEPGILEVGDPLERCYTPQWLADACVARLRVDRDRDLGIWVEPSAGGGAFVRAMQQHLQCRRVIAYDLDPRAMGLALADECHEGDWVQMARGLGASRIAAVVGNPPFSLAIEHLVAARATCPDAVIALILPLAILGVQQWQPVFREIPLSEVHPIAGRPWPALVRETAFFVWRPKWVGPWHGYPAISRLGGDL